TVFFEVADTSPALADLVDPATPDDRLAHRRADFIDEPERIRLQRHLQARLDDYQAQARGDPRIPKFASVFVTDRVGTQLAAAFDGTEANSPGKSVGFNVARRPYFSGNSEGEEQLRPPPNIVHIEQTHLSAVFFSKTQRTWKVAVSTPIYRDPVNREQFDGILVLTISLADFEVSTAALSSSDQFLVLVDGQGRDAGTILHHPLFKELKGQDREIPKELVGASDPQEVSSKYRVDPALLTEQQSADYVDPIGKYPDPLFKAYDRRWLAAAAPVLPPMGAGEKSESGLVVLMQSDRQAVVMPARNLGAQFMRNSFWMLVVMVTISLALWYIVVRLFREPSAKLNRAATPIESTPLQSMATIAARKEPKNRRTEEPN
ncbi:MAG TPA: hypothetical protein VFB80_05240, partial [Pirellulaceae bacterium]|nr:hypothetical protein [Pirellulaceae bacterium]